MNKECITIFVVFTSLFAVGNAMSRSMSCIYVNGQQKCTSQQDPTGNIATAAGAVHSDGTGVVGAGAGSPNDFETDFQQIGQGPYGINGVPGVGWASGDRSQNGALGYPSNPMFPKFDYPFQFVHDFFKRPQGYNRK